MRVVSHFLPPVLIVCSLTARSSRSRTRISRTPADAGSPSPLGRDYPRDDSPFHIPVTIPDAYDNALLLATLRVEHATLLIPPYISFCIHSAFNRCPSLTAYFTLPVFSFAFSPFGHNWTASPVWPSRALTALASSLPLRLSAWGDARGPPSASTRL